MNSEQELRAAVERVLKLADDLERFGPTFGPVDGTGRPDPKGQMMVDMPMEGLVADIRQAVYGKDPRLGLKRPSRVCQREGCGKTLEEHAFGVFCP